MYTMEQRKQIVKEFAQKIKKEFPQTNQYNILLFGSFLTDRYHENSDIDMGVFSLDKSLMFRLYMFAADYFDELGIAHDIIRMELDELLSQRTDRIYKNDGFFIWNKSDGYCAEEYCAGGWAE